MFWQLSHEKSRYSSGYSLAASPLVSHGSSTANKVPRAKESRQRCRLTRYHGFEVLHFPVVQSLFSFVCVVEILAVPTTSLINNPRHSTFFVKYLFGDAKIARIFCSLRRAKNDHSIYVQVSKLLKLT